MITKFDIGTSPRVRAATGGRSGGGASLSRRAKGPFADRFGAVHRSGLVGLALLVGLADFLFWGYGFGVSIGVFALAIFTVAALHKEPQVGLIKPALLMCAATLPVFEHVQAVSVGILILGGLCALGWLRAPKDGGWAWIIAAALRLAAFVPFGGLLASVAVLRKGRSFFAAITGPRNWQTKALWRKWSLPLGGSLVLGALLLSANPILENVVVRVFEFDMNISQTAPRIMFWAGVGLLVWPLLNPPKPSAPLSVSIPSLEREFGLNGGSVLRSLIVFNVLLGVQSVLDFSILLGNAALPEGMTYAAYAHRGAYPLMVTVMLAGGFAVAARPYLKEHAALKPLLILWIAQNTLLSFSAALRLDLYIGEYGLTYLRTYALIWIGLVGVGLIVVLWHVVRERPSFLLVMRLAAMGFGTLYLCAFINFAGFIAAHTLIGAKDTASVDWAYLCDLGPTAQKAVVENLAANPALVPPANFRFCFASNSATLNWRETDFRRVRTDLHP